MATQDAPEIQAFDFAYNQAVDFVSAAVLTTDRVMIARLAANIEELSRVAAITARPGSGKRCALAYRGWLAGFNAATLTAVETPDFRSLVWQAQTRRRHFERGADQAGFQPRGKWYACASCADKGEAYYYEGEGAARRMCRRPCGYCSPGLVVTPSPSNLRIYIEAIIEQERNAVAPVAGGAYARFIKAPGSRAASEASK
jgi:hypothetical protein